MKIKTLTVALAAALLAGGPGLAHATDLQALIDRATQGDSGAMVEAGEALLAKDRAVEGLLYLEHVVRLGRPEEHVARAHAALGGHYARVTNNSVATATSRSHYEQAAVLGHVPSQIKLAEIYLGEAVIVRGKERDQLLDRALVVLEHAAGRAGSAEAAHLLGSAFMIGRGFKVNKDVGAAWLMFAADRGHQAAALLAGRHELDMRRVETAQRYLAQAAQGGSADAAMLLAEGYFTGRVLAKDSAAALQWATHAKSVGAAGADRLIARIQPAPPASAPARAYAAAPQPAAAGTVGAIATSAESAEEARLRELEARNAELQRKVEALMAQAQGGPARTTTATPAAATSIAAAPAAVPSTPDLATINAQIEEEAESTSRWRRAPKLSQNERGLQEHGEGNFAQAARHFTRGVRSGDADAMNNLGMLLLQGQGVAMDRERAMSLFRQAAEKGHVVAARNIGYMYQQGMGVRQDLARATIWLRHAGALERRQVLGGNYAGI